MNARCESDSATLVDLLAEVSALLEDCSQIAGDIEHAIGDWLNHSADPKVFPIEKMQAIDLLRQIQTDLVALLGGEALAEEIRQNRNRVDIPSVIGTAKLERVRTRFERLAENTRSAVTASNTPAETGDVDLF